VIHEFISEDAAWSRITWCTGLAFFRERGAARLECILPSIPARSYPV
jgi:hypothetical protein